MATLIHDFNFKNQTEAVSSTTMVSDSWNPMAKAQEAKLHIAMFPWLAFGHIIPFLEYAKFLVQKGHRISFISTPKNIDRLPKIPPELATSITLVKIPLPKVKGLPENAEATMDVRTEDVEHLKKAYDGLQPELTRFLEDSVPDMIIYDFAPYWLPEAAAKLGISRVYFCIFNAWFFAFFGPTDMMVDGPDPRKKAEDFLVPPKWVPFKNKVAYKPFEANWMLSSAERNVSGVSDIYRAGKVVAGSDSILIRHCQEFEGAWLNLLGELHQKPFIPLGLMPPPTHVNGSDEKNETWDFISSWLEIQERGSVIYVALGSEVALNQSHVTQLALGLESSGLPFFWALRKPAGSNEPFELPDGYEERVKGRGLVWKGWAPQMRILSHESVGGFLTHCGWSSCVEGILFGLPLVMLPFLVDQGLNARVLDDNGVGIEVPRDEETGSYKSDSVAESVRLIMVENDGKRRRERAKELSLIFGDRELHNSYLEKSIV
ncbi:putative UDP-rhamnose:rhamnosyltransferase 1 [Coffea eugenioides]|uniref:putative UDP-rhamnose:rhamnosyltransferase 1 n=1 Tax=Coffea eugenioides TaxID=49369 RepID=UPI000F60A2C7|nr:putative UDP-rhamnose:rhamnosyltransferase 1 [Coffea eugenioides]